MVLFQKGREIVPLEIHGFKRENNFDTADSLETVNISFTQQLHITGYLQLMKFNQLGNIIFSFFGLSKDTPENES